MHVELAGDSVEILSGRSKHKYLGKTLVGDLRHRAEVELGHRLQVTWAKFHKHGHVLTNKHVALKLRLKFFDSVLSPTVLFGLATLPLSKSQLQRLDVTQRKMLRTIVGWVAVDSTDWKTTMQRMNEKLDAALRLYPISLWSDAVFRKQFRLSARVCRHLERWPAAATFLESSWQCRRIFYKPTFSKTWTPTSAMGWQLTEIWWNAISTKNMVHSCSTYCLMAFFWKRVRPVLSWNVCIVNLWLWFV